MNESEEDVSGMISELTLMISELRRDADYAKFSVAGARAKAMVPGCERALVALQEALASAERIA